MIEGVVYVVNGRKVERNSQGGYMYHWSRAMIEELVRRYPDESNVSIAEDFGMSKNTIYRKAVSLGLKKSETYVASNRKRAMEMANLCHSHHAPSERTDIRNYMKNETEEQKTARLEAQKKTNASVITKIKRSVASRKNWSKKTEEEMLAFKGKVSDAAKKRDLHSLGAKWRASLSDEEKKAFYRRIVETRRKNHEAKQC